MLDLESPITGSSKVRTSSRLEPAYANPSLQENTMSLRMIYAMLCGEGNGSLGRSSPKDGADPHGVAIVEDIVREQCKGRVTLVPHARVNDTTSQKSP